MRHSLNDVPRARLTLCTNHRCAFTNAPQCLSQVLCTANKRHRKLRLVDVELVIRRRQHFTLIDVIDTHSFEDTRLYDVTNTALRHHRNGYSFHNFLNDSWISHA